jgi:hypothetical protein
VKLEYERALASDELRIRTDRESAIIATLADRMVAAQTEVYDRAIEVWRTEQLRRAETDPAALAEQPDTVIKVPRLVLEPR